MTPEQSVSEGDRKLVVDAFAADSQRRRFCWRSWTNAAGAAIAQAIDQLRGALS